MKVSRRLWLLVVLLVVALVGSACGDDDDDGGSGDDTTLPSVPADSTMKKIQDRGKLVVGVKFDQPGFGLKDPATGGDPVGF